MRALGLVAVFLLCTTPAFTDATFRIVTTDLADEGLNDLTPAEPVGGNDGTTIGEQRRIALQHAADIWGSIIDSPVEIIVHANFEEMSCSETSAVLGSASAATVYNRFPNAPVPETWYVAALASRLSGQDLDEGTPAIVTRLNSLLEGDPQCGGGKSWYYGLDNNARDDQYDLVVVALHELGHGLGFSTMADKQTGRLLAGKPDIYSSFLLDNESGLRWSQMDDEQRAASASNTGRLVWSGANTTEASPSVLAPRDLLDVSSPVELRGLYVLGSASFGPAVPGAGVTGQIVAARDAANIDGPSETDGCTTLENGAEIAGRIALIDRGECAFAVKVRRAQDAGAIAVIIANTADTILTMTGDDESISIPAVSVTASDGAAIREHLDPGVMATIRQDPQHFSGADEMHRVQLYAPEQVISGSSVSHWDRAARPDLLMEPNISSSLRHDVDLARDLFADLGWFASSFAGARMTSFVLNDHDRDGLADAGDTVRIRTTIRNRTAVIGQGLVLETTLPPGLILLDTPDVVDGPISDGRALRFELGNLPADTEREVSFDLLIDPILAPAGPIVLQGTISGSNILPSRTDDPTTPQPDDPTSIAISNTPLVATKAVALHDDADGSGNLSSHDELLYVVTITNHSDIPVDAVRYDDVVDPNTSLVPGSVVLDSGAVLEGNEPGQLVVRADLGTLAPAASVEIRYQVRVRPGIAAGTQSIRNQGVVAGAGIDNQVTDDPRTHSSLDPTIILLPGDRSRAVRPR